MSTLQKNIIKLCIVFGIFLTHKYAFAYTDLSGTSVMLTSNTTWTLSGSPYVVDLVQIDNNAVLTIEPGVIVKFTYGGAGQAAQIDIISGAIVANGTETQPIIFTSYNDDVGGDTNQDANQTQPEMFDWEGLFILPQQNVPSEFNNIKFSYSGWGLEFNYGSIKNSNFTYNNEALAVSGGNFGPEPVVVENIHYQHNGVAFSMDEGRILSFTNEVFDSTNEVAVSLNGYAIYTCDGCVFSGGDIGISVKQHSNLNLTNSLVENYQNYGIFNQYISQSLLPDAEDSEIYISNSEIRNNTIGIQIGANGYGEIVNNSIHDNTQFGVKVEQFTEPAPMDLRNNWWGDPSGPHETLLNPGGLGDNLQLVNTPYIPWTTSIAPTELAQYKMDGTTSIGLGEINLSDRYVFSISTPNISNQKKVEVEIKPHTQSFDSQNTFISDFQANTDALVVSVFPVEQGSYKWRARILDSSGIPGQWYQFGENGENDIDFVSKPIPHFTQNQSQYPDIDLSFQWSRLPYANGRGNYTDPITGKKGCGLNISACGCALVSAVMILNYYEVENNESDEIDPNSLNKWMNEHNGYGHHGDVDWYKIATFSGNQIQFAERTEGVNNTKLDEYLNQHYPAIAYMKSSRKQPNSKGGGHFVVIGNKLVSTYEIRDPANYDTYTLNDEPSPGKKIRSYFNGYDGLRLFKPSNGVAINYTKVHMASPADILVTDSLGRSIGKNPLTGQLFEQIPGAMYVSEMIGSPDENDENSDTHEWKTAYIPNLGNVYDVDVFGTGNGLYRLDVEKMFSSGVEQSTGYDGIITNGATQSFSVDSTGSTPLLKDEKIDRRAPSLLLSLSVNEKKDWVVNGEDENMPIVTSIKADNFEFSTSDRFGNTTFADFDVVSGYRVPAIGKINLELKSVTINNDSKAVPYSWISYDWNVNSGPSVWFKQVISIGNMMVNAEYSQSTNQTVVTITGNGITPVVYTFTKLKIIKFTISPNGEPGYQL